MADDQLQPQLRVGDAERDQVLGLLQNAYAEGRLDLEEYQERQSRCLDARYREDLTQLTADLPEDSTWTVTTAPAPRLVPRPTNQQPGRLEVAFMSGKDIFLDDGLPSITGLAFWGGHQIHTDAVMGPGAEVVLSLNAIMGGFTVYVPPGVKVRDESMGIMGGNTIHKDARGDGSNGTLIIKGFAFWGGSDIKLSE